MALLSEIKEHIKASGPCLMVLLIALVLTGGFIDCWSCVIGTAVSAVSVSCPFRCLPLCSCRKTLMQSLYGPCCLILPRGWA